MARKMRDDLPNTPLVKARRALVTARADFEQRKAAEWQELSAALQATVDRMVGEMRAAGSSVSEICEAYGTKDRRTILDAIARYERVSAYTESPNPFGPLPAHEFTYNPSTKTLTNHTLGSTVEVDTQRYRVTRNDPEHAAWWLDYVHNNPTHEAWEATRDA